VAAVVAFGSTRPLASPPAYVIGGHPAGLAVVRALGQAGIPVAAVSSSPEEHAWRSRYSRWRVRAPDPDTDEQGFIAALLNLADELGEGVIIPTTDESLEAVARHRAELARRHTVASPSSSVARRFLDKSQTYAIATEVGVAAPETLSPTSERDLEISGDGLSFPCLIKPRESYRYSRAFGVKMKTVRSQVELRTAWTEATNAGIETMIQELIPGAESAGVNYNAYIVDGRPVAEVTARKLRQSPRDYGFPSAVVSSPVREVIEPGRSILRGLGVSGFANVEFKQDSRDGTYKLMEVNGRPNMSGWLSIRCGVNFPLLTYRHLLGQELPAGRRPESGVYWVHEVSYPKTIAAGLRSGEPSLAENLKPYLYPHVFATLSARDPAVFFGRAGARLWSKVRSP